MAQVERPLSPHIQIYKPQISSVLSILHRLTGIGLAVGTLLLTWWLTAAAYGVAAFTHAQGFMASWFGQLLLLGFSFAFFYHLCNGIRHLFWDMGKGFDLDTATKTGWLVVIAAVALTAIAWWYGLTMGGGA
jgi:succinate dehydrogenase / fumarate reductase, cytochrome b subunit